MIAPMWLLLFACTETKLPDDSPIVEVPTGDSGTTDTATEPPEDLGDPYLAMVAAVPAGILAPDCVMRLDLLSGKETLLSISLDPALGGEWAGAPLEGGVQYRVSAYHSTCTEQTPSETIESGTFSGVAGLLFVYWFNGTNGGVEALTQTEDYAGGSVTITLQKGTPSTQIEAIAVDVGATLAPGKEPDTYVASFPTETPIGVVLAAMSVADGFVEGTPAWIEKPNWW